MRADLKFHNGVVLTQDEALPVTDALAVVGERIVALGDAAKAMPAERVIDLRGRALIPGFVDAHNHFVSYGVRLMRLDLSRVRDKIELLSSVTERAGMTPADGWIVGHSWDETKWDDPAMPTLDELDKASGGRRMLLQRVDRHGGFVSTPAANAAGLPKGGFLVEEDYAKVVDLTEPSLPTLVKGIAAASRRAHELGVTSSHVIAHGQDLAALQAAREAGVLGVRVSCYLGEELIEYALGLGARRGLGDGWIRVMGLKLYSDGSFGSRTAAVSFPYLDKPGESGMFMHAEGKLESLVKRARAGGLQLAVHAIGDRAARRVLDAFESAGVTAAERARIEHLELVTDEDIRRAAAMGIVASVQPNFTGEWGHKGGMYEARLGWPAASRLNRFRAYAEAGLPLAFGSDDMPLGPLYGIRSAVEAPEPSQRVSVEQAIQAYTAGAAWAGFGENEVGALREGLLADLVVLSGDPRSADVAGLAVDLTVLGGVVVHDRRA